MPVEMDRNLKLRLQRTIGQELFHELYEGTIKPFERYAGCVIDTALAARFVRVLATLVAEHNQSQGYALWMLEIAEAITADLGSAKVLCRDLAAFYERCAEVLRLP